MSKLLNHRSEICIHFLKNKPIYEQIIIQEIESTISKNVKEILTFLDINIKKIEDITNKSYIKEFIQKQYDNVFQSLNIENVLTEAFEEKIKKN